MSRKIILYLYRYIIVIRKSRNDESFLRTGRRPYLMRGAATSGSVRKKKGRI